MLALNRHLKSLFNKPTFLNSFQREMIIANLDKAIAFDIIFDGHLTFLIFRYECVNFHPYENPKQIWRRFDIKNGLINDEECSKLQRELNFIKKVFISWYLPPPGMREIREMINEWGFDQKYKGVNPRWSDVLDEHYDKAELEKKYGKWEEC